MEIGVGFDALNTSKRINRSSTGNDSVESSAREDDLVDEIDASAPDFGMLPWEPMNGLRCKIGPAAKGRCTNPIRQSESSSTTSYSLVKGYSIVAQKRLGNESGKRVVITSPDVENSFPFQRSCKRIKGKEVESKANYRQNFPVMGPSICTRSMKRKSDEIASSSKKDKDMNNENGCRGAALTEIDKLYPEARCCNSHGQQSGVSDNSSAIASRIESYEIFAGELQPPFYHVDTKFIGMEKVDEIIAWSLQRDEDEDEDAATLAGNGHSTSKGERSRWIRRTAIIDEFQRLQRKGDLEKRPDLYEAWEDLLENIDMFEHDNLASCYTTVYLIPSDIDESNHQLVDASVINNLPLTLIQNDNDKEACAVCLEIPSVGETMRYLPCLHKFHKMCIDEWLKRKPSCPVCKFNITLS